MYLSHISGLDILNLYFPMAKLGHSSLQAARTRGGTFRETVLETEGTFRGIFRDGVFSKKKFFFSQV